MGEVKFSYKISCCPTTSLSVRLDYIYFVIKKKKKKAPKRGCKRRRTPKQTLNIFLLKVNFDKFTIELHNLLILSIITKFIEDQRLRWYSNPPTPLALRKSSGWYL